MVLNSLKGSLARCGRLVCVGVVVVGCVGTTVAAPVRLKVEQRVNPLGIDVKRPVLSWQSDSTERNWKQTAYEIRVSSTTAELVRGRPDV
ncbi:MAG TPA: hypothetical protein VFS41_07795, partial [Edaphobacter sp.]|nr:hypothetical protein [Edaphobacter sp.]